MIYRWYKIFNLTEFLATNLVSRELTVFLTDTGERKFLITSGNEISVLYENKFFLPLQFNDENPFVSGVYAIYVKPITTDVYFGIPPP